MITGPCEVVKSQANHKEFHYCRSHKDECSPTGCLREAPVDDTSPLSMEVKVKAFQAKYLSPTGRREFQAGDRVQYIGCNPVAAYAFDLSVHVVRPFFDGTSLCVGVDVPGRPGHIYAVNVNPSDWRLI